MTNSHDNRLLDIEGLSIRYSARDGDVIAVDDVSFTLNRGERLAIIGESGSGKSSITHALLGILPPSAVLTSARGNLDGIDFFSGLSQTQWNDLRRHRIAYVPQDPNIALNPVQQVGQQLSEAIRLSAGKIEKLQVREQSLALLTRVGIGEAERVFSSYPHQISGGQRQRVLIAIALIGEPALIVADEPTSGLDVTVQKTVLDLLDELVIQTGVALVLVTHDLAVARQRSDRLLVLERGRIVESGATAAVINAPQHPHTTKLLSANPSLQTGKLQLSAGLPLLVDRSAGHQDGSGVLVTDLKKTYVTRDSRRGKITNPAVRGVSFEIERGSTYGLVGESGSGKSTIARIIAGIDRPDSGQVIFDGQDFAHTSGRLRRTLRQSIQYVFQNPYTSLNPRFTVFDSIAEPLRGFALANGTELGRRVSEVIDSVGLEQSFLQRKPTELSGGQRQRVAIARSLVIRPELIILDEPVSALDVSVQAQILQLLVDLQYEYGITYLFISHDLAVIRQLSDRVGVLSHGELIEEGTVATVFENPQNVYTQRLIDSIPVFS